MRMAFGLGEMGLENADASAHKIAESFATIDEQIRRSIAGEAISVPQSNPVLIRYDEQLQWQGRAASTAPAAGFCCSWGIDDMDRATKTYGVSAVVVLGLAVTLGGSAVHAEERNEADIHQQALRALAVSLPKAKPAGMALDDKLAHRWFNIFLDRLDPRRLYFTAGDVRRFARHRDKLDDHAVRGDLAFAELVRETYRQRLGAAHAIGLEWLDKRHDFSADESFQPETTTFPKNAAALRERWRKWVKHEILLERSAGYSHEEAVSRLRARYERVARDRQYADDELYEIYLDSLAKAFGPHNRYMGERTLEQFRQ